MRETVCKYSGTPTPARGGVPGHPGGLVQMYKIGNWYKCTIPGENGTSVPIRPGPRGEFPWGNNLQWDCNKFPGERICSGTAMSTPWESFGTFVLFKKSWNYPAGAVSHFITGAMQPPGAHGSAREFQG